MKGQNNKTIKKRVGRKYLRDCLKCGKYFRTNMKYADYCNKCLMSIKKRWVAKQRAKNRQKRVCVKCGRSYSRTATINLPICIKCWEKCLIGVKI